MPDKNRVEVRIAGKDYRIKGVESDEYLQRIGLYVDKKMNEIMKRNNKLSTSMVAVLTALNVADDYMKTRESEQNLKKELENARNRIQALMAENKRIAKLNEELGKSNTDLQLELAKREAELREVRNSLEKMSKSKVVY
jgi:cell division protein ZapA